MHDLYTMTINHDSVCSTFDKIILIYVINKMIVSRVDNENNLVLGN